MDAVFSRQPARHLLSFRRVVASRLDFFAVCLFGALSFVLAIGWTLDLHNADSLIPVLVSLDFWLPFYWGQDRFGMLLPLLALPIRDSFWNLIGQNAIGVFLLLVGAHLAARRCGVRQPAIVAIALLSLVLAWPAQNTVLQLLTTNQSYGPALGLYALAFALPCFGSSWLVRAAAAFLMLLGAWTNAGTALLMLAVFLVAVGMRRLRPDAIWMLAGVILSLAGHLILQQVTPGIRLDTSHVTLPAPADVIPQAVGFWSDAYQRFLGPAVWLTVPGVLFALRLERGNPTARQAVLAVVVGCGLYGLVMIVFFGGEGRHLTPALPLLLGAILVVFARHLASAVATPTGFVLTALVLLQSGVDWPEAGRRRLISRLAEGHAVELYQEGVTVVTGDYWEAWEYTFALNLLHERVTGSRPVLPVALRSEDFYLPRAQHVTPGTKLAVVPSNFYLYWTVRGPKVELSVVSVAEDYEVAVVKGVGD
jgi:hypothetical protein